MDAEKINKLRDLLVKACDKHLQEGGKIVAGRFDVGGCCPIQCAVGPGIDRAYDIALSKLLNFELLSSDMWSFLDGFDGHAFRDTPEYKLGQELRAKYITKEEK